MRFGGTPTCIVSILLMLIIYIVDIIDENLFKSFASPLEIPDVKTDQFHIFCSVHRQSFLRRAGELANTFQLTHHLWVIGPFEYQSDHLDQTDGNINSLNNLQCHFFRRLHTYTKPAFQVDVVQPTIESPRIIFLLPFPRCHEDPHLHLDRVVKLAGIGKS